MALFQFGSLTLEETKTILEPSLIIPTPLITPPIQESLNDVSLKKKKNLNMDNIPPSSMLNRFQTLLQDKISLKRHAPEIHGLWNTGNTCFQNVILQSLLSISSLYTLLHALGPPQKEEFIDACPLWYQLVVFFHAFEEPVLGRSAVTEKKKTMQHTVTVPPGLQSFFQKYQRQAGDQEDTQEFLEHVLTTLETEYIHGIGPFLKPSTAQASLQKMVQSWSGAVVEEVWHEVGGYQYTRDESPISWLFGGLLRISSHEGADKETVSQKGSKTGNKKGSGNKKETVQREPIMALHVNLEDTLDKAMIVHSTPVLIHGTYNRFQSTSVLEWPLILIIHIKRFTYSSTRGVLKLNDGMKYPAMWTPPACCSAIAVPDYLLRAVIVHHGCASGGHYTVYTKNGYGVWHHFDDEKIKMVTEDEVIRQSAYQLMYEQRDSL